MNKWLERALFADFILIVLYIIADYGMWTQLSLQPSSNVTLVNVQASYYFISKNLIVNGIYQTSQIYQTVGFVSSLPNLTLLLFAATILINIILLWKATTSPRAKIN